MKIVVGGETDSKETTAHQIKRSSVIKRKFLVLAGTVIFNLILYYLVMRNFGQSIETRLFEVYALDPYEAEFVAQLVTFFYAAFLPGYLLWFLLGYSSIRTLISVLVISGLPLGLERMFRSEESCFNQRTGEPLQWYVLRSNGELITSTVDGFDPVSKEMRQPVTPEICRIIYQQSQGIWPKEIVANLDEVEFFDGISGQPKIWFSEDGKGRVRLFDAEGFSQDRQRLLPVTPEIMERIKASSSQMSEVSPIENKQTSSPRPSVYDPLMPDNYEENTLFIGTVSKQTGPDAESAIRSLEAALYENARKQGISAAEFPAAFYAEGYFSETLAGDMARLRESALTGKMRAAILVELESKCSASSMLEGVFSCTTYAEVRLIDQGAAKSSKSHLKGTSASISKEEALASSVRQLVEANPASFHIPFQ